MNEGNETRVCGQHLGYRDVAAILFTIPLRYDDIAVARSAAAAYLSLERPPFSLKSNLCLPNYLYIMCVVIVIIY